MQTAPPHVDFCLVCEDFRREVGNKITILGFYGLLPRVQIFLKEWGKAVEKMLFLISTHGGSATFTAQANVLNPDGSLLISSPSVKGDPSEDESDSRIGFAFLLLTFKEQGQHELQVLINNEEAYRQTFLVKQGPIAGLTAS